MRPSVKVTNGLAIYSFGSGEPILLMPGPHRLQRPGLSSADALIAALVKLGRRVITFDPPASGRSTRPAQLGMAEMHACATETLESSEIEGPADLLGHSMAGLVSLAYAIEHPTRVRSLILIGTGSGRAYMSAPGALWNRAHPAFPRVALVGILYTLWPSRATEKLMARLIERHAYHQPRMVDPQSIHLGDWLRAGQGRGSEWHAIARRLDYTSRLDRVEAPTLILCGRHDTQFPPACSQELAAGIRHSQAITFDHSGHFPFLEEPQAFQQALSSFLETAPD